MLFRSQNMTTTLIQRQQNNSSKHNKSRICKEHGCCHVLGSCLLGIRFGENGGGVNWCKDPC